MSSEVYALARLRALRVLLADLRFSFDGVPASGHAPVTWTQRPARVQPTAGASVVASWLIGGSMSPSPSALDSTVSQSFEVAVYVAVERAADVQAIAAQAFEAVAVALRGASMFSQVKVPLLGVVENMSYFADDQGRRQHLFGQGGGQRVAAQLGTEFLGEIPLDPAVRQGGDHGIPVVISHPDSLPARAFHALGLRLLQLLGQ